MSTREQLFDRQKGACWYCVLRMTKANGHAHSVTRDHRTPKSAGGGATRSNLVGACRRCNELKGSLTEVEFRRLYPTPNAIETASPLERFEGRVRKKRRRPKVSAPPTTIRADHQAVWEDLKRRFAPRPPPRPVGFCSGCRFFGGLAPGYAPICQHRWQRGEGWGHETPLTSSADSCEEHLSR